MTSTQAAAYLRPDGFAYHTTPQQYVEFNVLSLAAGQEVAYWPAEGEEPADDVVVHRIGSGAYLLCKLLETWQGFEGDFLPVDLSADGGAKSAPYSAVPVQGAWTLVPTPE